MSYQYRSIFISDVHLGTRDARSDCLLEFLRNTEAEFIYLLGDIVDLWNLKKGWYWPQTNNHIAQCLMQKAQQGTRVMYIPGNHDERLRDYIGSNVNDIRICQDAIHETADKRKLLLIHGDEFDSVVMGNKWLVHFGDWLYNNLVVLNRYYNYLRRKLGFPYWSLSSFLKTRNRKAMEYINSFENAVAYEAKNRRVDGVVCGHIHHPAIKTVNGIVYSNAGDWVENCTAVVEKQDGQLRVLYWESERVSQASAQIIKPLPSSKEAA
ncbi:MAG: UDP-2,3-diacylglucosamine diphosphatase [Gammaproteobacteria bacterium]|jgi:UDP-2,3-diacylglucosamine pyrophosphatase LpxH